VYIIITSPVVFSGDLAAAIRNKTDLHFGLYHSLFEWFNPMFLADQASGYKTRDFVEVHIGSIVCHTFLLEFIIEKFHFVLSNVNRF